MNISVVLCNTDTIVMSPKVRSYLCFETQMKSFIYFLVDIAVFVLIY